MTNQNGCVCTFLPKKVCFVLEKWLGIGRSEGLAKHPRGCFYGAVVDLFGSATSWRFAVLTDPTSRHLAKMAHYMRQGDWQKKKKKRKGENKSRKRKKETTSCGSNSDADPKKETLGS